MEVVARSEAAVAPPLRIDESIDELLGAGGRWTALDGVGPGATARIVERTSRFAAVSPPASVSAGPSPAPEMIRLSLRARLFAGPPSTAGLVCPVAPVALTTRLREIVVVPLPGVRRRSRPRACRRARWCA